jgi:hypothetical protein
VSLREHSRLPVEEVVDESALDGMNADDVCVVELPSTKRMHCEMTASRIGKSPIVAV